MVEAGPAGTHQMGTHMSPCPHCGCDLEPRKKGKPRSVQHHRRYFAVVRAAHSHWPESHRFQPASEEHLRKWLQAKSGHHEITTLDTADMTREQAVVALAGVIAKAAPYHFVSASGAKLHVIQSRSIDFDTLPHLAACALFDAVADVIEAETGLKVSQIMPPISEKRPTTVEQFSEVPL